MSEAGISDRPNREDSNSPEVKAAPGEQPQPSKQAESTAVTRFEQRISTGGTQEELTPKGLPRLREADWFSLARKLRQRNRDLLKKVASLEQALAEAQEALQAESARCKSADTLNTQHAKELDAAREKISQLYSELETSHQTAQYHSRSVEQLSTQLDAASHRIAELERECAFLQQRCDEQSHQVEAAEQKNCELSARLQRQQRRTLQFKAALDKCLEARAIESAKSEPRTASALLEGSPTAKTQPIQPWSSGETLLEELSDRLPLWANKTLGDEGIPQESSSADEATAGDPSELTSVERGVVDLEPQYERYPSDSTSFELFEQLEPIEWEVEPTESDTFDAVFEILSFPAESSPEQTEMLRDVRVQKGDSDSSGEESDAELSPAPRNFEAVAPPQSNFPSPLVYPNRRERKHKSFASIELPKFLHSNQ